MIDNYDYILIRIMIPLWSTNQYVFQGLRNLIPHLFAEPETWIYQITHQTQSRCSAVGVANGFNHGNNVHKFGYHPYSGKKSVRLKISPAGPVWPTDALATKMKHGHCQWLPCFFLGATGMSAKNIPWFPSLVALVDPASYTRSHVKFVSHETIWNRYSPYETVITPN